jgi:hypothetical protein
MLRRALPNPSRLLRSRQGMQLIIPAMTRHQSSSLFQAPLIVHRPFALRTLSSDTKKEKSDADSDTKEIVLTPGEKVVVASRLGLWLGIGAFAAACAFYIGKELLPT